MIAQGYPNKIIAAVLEIGSWTVGTHVRHLLAKLQVSSRAAMVAKLSALGMGAGSGFGCELPFRSKAIAFTPAR